MPRKSTFWNKRPGRRIAAMLLAAAVIAVPVYYFFGRPDKTPEVRVSTLRKGDISSRMYVKAAIRPGRSAGQDIARRQKVTAVFVKPGDQVSAGDVLLTLDQTELRAQYEAAREARISLEQSIAADEKAAAEVQEQSKAAQEKLSGLLSDLTNRLSELARLAAADTNPADNSEYDAALQALQSAADELNRSFPEILSAIAQDVSSGAAGGIDLSSELTAQLQSLGITVSDPLTQARALEKSTKEALDASVPDLRASISGIVSRVNVQAGGYTGTAAASAGGSLQDAIAGIIGESLAGSLGMSASQPDPAVVIYDNLAPKAVFKVSQFDSERLSVGMKVGYTMNGKSYSGAVTYKSPFVEDSSIGGTAAGDLLASAGIVASTDSDPQLVIEMSIEGEGLTDLVIGFLIDAEIVTASADDVLVLPAEAMRREVDDYYVFTVDGKGILTRKSFVPGIQSDMYVEVLSGLAEGDRVVLSPASVLGDGAKVRVTGEG